MSRLEALSREINKGIDVDEKTGVQIPDWTPNNVRRLVVGLRYAVVLYHVRGKKYPKIVSLVRFKDSDIREDIDLAQKGKYKSILRALTQGRICSSVEEIYIVTNGYPSEQMANIDSDMGSLVDSRTTLRDRFVRLQHVSKIRVEEDKAIMGWMGETHSPTESAYALLEQGVKGVRLLSSEKVNDEWWSRTALRGHIYPIDRKWLEGHFAAVKEQFDKVKKEDRDKDFLLERYRDAFRDTVNKLNALGGVVEKVREFSRLVLDGMSGIERAEWGDSLLEVTNPDVFKKVHDRDSWAAHAKETVLYTGRFMDLYGEYDGERRSDLGVELDKTKVGLVFEYLPVSDKVEGIIPEDRAGLQSMRKVLDALYVAISMVPYKALYLYLARNKDKYIKYYADMLPGIEAVSYTRTIIEECARAREKVQIAVEKMTGEKPEESKVSVFGEAGMRLVEVAGHQISLDALKILRMFISYKEQRKVV